MLATLIALPTHDPTARDAALNALRGWTTTWRADIRDRWIVGPDELMLVAAAPALAALPPALVRREHARTTRWALLARTKASRRFGSSAQVVVFEPGLEGPSASTNKIRVLGVGVEGDVATVRVPKARLDPPRIGKLDHPALLLALERETAAGSYWPATTTAHAAATEVAAKLREDWP